MAHENETEELLDLCYEVDENFLELSYTEAQEAQAKLEVRIKEIGQELFDEGGEHLMREVHGEVAGRCPFGRYLEGAWDRVGTWMG